MKIIKLERFVCLIYEMAKKGRNDATFDLVESNKRKYDSQLNKLLIK